MVRSVVHPARSDLRVLANPLKIDGKRLEQVAAPNLGADTEAVLAELPAAKSATRARA